MGVPSFLPLLRPMHRGAVQDLDWRKSKETIRDKQVRVESLAIRSIFFVQRSSALSAFSPTRDTNSNSQHLPPMLTS